MSYSAIVAQLQNVRKHPNADRLQLATVYGSQIVVGLEQRDGDVGIYFPTDGQLSEEFCEQNNLIGKKNPETGQREGGLFDHKRRVRTQRFRGEKSDGFWIPYNAVNYTGIDIAASGLGYQFTELNGHKICSKYIVAKTFAQANSMKSKKKYINKMRKNYGMLKEHFDTAQWVYNAHRVTEGAYVTITEKVHGCVDASTIINTLEFGDLSIKEIIDNKIQCHIKTLNTISNEIEYESIGDYYFKENTSNWYEIELEDGTVLIITGDNPVWFPEEKCYREVQNLKNKDILLID
jgi:hypothetical protein